MSKGGKAKRKLSGNNWFRLVPLREALKIMGNNNPSEGIDTARLSTGMMVKVWIMAHGVPRHFDVIAGGYRPADPIESVWVELDSIKKGFYSGRITPHPDPNRHREHLSLTRFHSLDVGARLTFHSRHILGVRMPD